MTNRPCFLTLPLELRDTIYDHLLVGTQVSFEEQGEEWFLAYKAEPTLPPKQTDPSRGWRPALYKDRYKKSEPSASARAWIQRQPRPSQYDRVDFAGVGTVPQWLQTCRQVYEEALDQFYREAYCYAWLHARRTSPPPPSVGTLRRQFDLGRLQRINPIYGHELTSIGIELVINWKNLADAPVPGAPDEILSSTLADDEKSRRISPSLGMFDALSAYPHSIKDMTILIDIYSRVSVNSKVIFSADLSLFETLGSRFDRVTFRIIAPKYVPNDECLPTEAAAFPSIQREILRVAKFMVGAGNSGSAGGGSSGCHVHDYLKEIKTEFGERTGGYDWCLEANRTIECTDREDILRYNGLQYFEDSEGPRSRKRHYFGPLQREGNQWIWPCSAPGLVRKMDIPDAYTTLSVPQYSGEIV